MSPPGTPRKSRTSSKCDASLLAYKEDQDTEGYPPFQSEDKDTYLRTMLEVAVEMRVLPGK